MIPRHRPPFGLLSLAKSTVRSLVDRRKISDLEHAYARWLNVDHAVWIPSARYGIARTIDAHLPNTGTVYCPAFNCGAVFHAAQECRRDIQYVDCADNSFLMDTAVQPVLESAVILSEMFGERFSSTELSKPLVADAQMRIFDMAMSIPRAADMDRMRDRDVTVLSFGLGKSLFTGWGGLALTHSTEVADVFRKRRDADLQTASIFQQSISHLKIWARTAAHHPYAYGPLRRSKYRSSDSNRPATFSASSPEWNRGATSLSRQVSFDNLTQADSWANHKRKLSERYAHQLTPNADLVQLPKPSTNALSHFCVRVSAATRDTIIEHLWQKGIDVGTLFPFPKDLCSPTDFPNAVRSSVEILNLPLSNLVTTRDVDRISNAIIAAIGSSCATKSRPAQTKAA